MYQIKYMFDWGSGVCCWADDELTEKFYGDYPIFTEQLPISDSLKTRLETLIARHDEALNWEQPNDELLWDKEQTAEFTENAVSAYNSLCEELGEKYNVIFKSEWLI